MKDCQIIQSVNTSGIMDTESIPTIKERRKNSQPGQKQTIKSFFRDAKN